MPRNSTSDYRTSRREQHEKDDYGRGRGGDSDDSTRSKSEYRTGRRKEDRSVDRYRRERSDERRTYSREEKEDREEKKHHHKKRKHSSKEDRSHKRKHRDDDDERKKKKERKEKDREDRSKRSSSHSSPEVKNVRRVEDKRDSPAREASDERREGLNSGESCPMSKYGYIAEHSDEDGKGCSSSSTPDSVYSPERYAQRIAERKERKEMLKERRKHNPNFGKLDFSHIAPLPVKERGSFPTKKSTEEQKEIMNKRREQRNNFFMPRDDSPPFEWKAEPGWMTKTPSPSPERDRTKRTPTPPPLFATNVKTESKKEKSKPQQLITLSSEDEEEEKETTEPQRLELGDLPRLKYSQHMFGTGSSCKEPKEKEEFDIRSILPPIPVSAEARAAYKRIDQENLQRIHAMTAQTSMLPTPYYPQTSRGSASSLFSVKESPTTVTVTMEKSHGRKERKEGKEGGEDTIEKQVNRSYGSSPLDSGNASSGQMSSGGDMETLQLDAAENGRYVRRYELNEGTMPIYPTLHPGVLGSKLVIDLLTGEAQVEGQNGRQTGFTKLRDLHFSLWSDQSFQVNFEMVPGPAEVMIDRKSEETSQKCIPDFALANALIEGQSADWRRSELFKNKDFARRKYFPATESDEDWERKQERKRKEQREEFGEWEDDKMERKEDDEKKKSSFDAACYERWRAEKEEEEREEQTDQSLRAIANEMQKLIEMRKEIRKGKRRVKEEEEEEEEEEEQR